MPKKKKRINNPCQCLRAQDVLFSRAHSAWPRGSRIFWLSVKAVSYLTANRRTDLSRQGFGLQVKRTPWLLHHVQKQSTPGIRARITSFVMLLPALKFLQTCNERRIDPGYGLTWSEYELSHRCLTKIQLHYEVTFPNTSSKFHVDPSDSRIKLNICDVKTSLRVFK